MTDKIPLRLDGSSSSPADPEALGELFTALGFTHPGNHKQRNVRHDGQGGGP
ncbi:MAG TPA: hypothetical protein VK391_02900 [Allosphingosinicella sp.]|nr:hypothetical protein [Allosphingosinicella sp.]